MQNYPEVFTFSLKWLKNLTFRQNKVSRFAIDSPIIEIFSEAVHHTYRLHFRIIILHWPFQVYALHIPSRMSEQNIWMCAKSHAHPILLVFIRLTVLKKILRGRLPADAKWRGMVQNERILWLRWWPFLFYENRWIVNHVSINLTITLCHRMMAEKKTHESIKIRTEAGKNGNSSDVFSGTVVHVLTISTSDVRYTDLSFQANARSLHKDRRMGRLYNRLELLYQHFCRIFFN